MKRTNDKPLEWVRDNQCIRCTSHYHDRQNYPFLRRYGRRYKIVRWIMLRKFGEQPPTIVSRHSCDNSWCINPDHIEKGTPADNSRDMVQRNRHGAGSRNAMAKLSESDVLEIIDMEGTHQAIADVFGISRNHVTNIKNGKRWHHQPETIRNLPEGK